MIFGLPLLMTMEMWWIALYMDRVRLAILLVATVPLLVGLSHYSGFEETFDWLEDAVDACVAFGVGFVTSAVLLWLLGVVGPGMSVEEVVGKITLQAVPASIGALLAQSQFGENESGSGSEGRARIGTYGSQLFLMATGALFLAFNLAPTEEMVLLAYMMHPWQVLGLIALALAAMHGFVYAARFRGQEEAPGQPAWSVFLRYTVVGFAIATLISAYVLWTFGRTDGLGTAAAVTTTMVLAFPAAIGAAAARLLL